jgi:hypothetical protein
MSERWILLISVAAAYTWIVRTTEIERIVGLASIPDNAYVVDLQPVKRDKS